MLELTSARDLEEPELGLDDVRLALEAYKEAEPGDLEQAWEDFLTALDEQVFELPEEEVEQE